MSPKLAVVTVIGAACVAAAAAGGYFALRANPAAGVAAPASVAPPAFDASAAAVEPTPPAPAAAEQPTVTQAQSARGVRSANRAPARSQSADAKAPSVSDVGGGAAAVAPLPAPATVDPPGTDWKDLKNDPPAIAAPPEPPRPQFEAITVKENSVVGIRLDSTISSKMAHVEDKVTARVARDVTVDGHTAIPSGARLEGVVSAVDHGGKFKDRARLGIRFQSVFLPDGMRIPIQTETIFREGESPTGGASSKVGASAVIGGILGAMIGGKKGAIVGSTAGAAGGTAAVMAGDSNEAVIQAGTPLTLRLTSPMNVTIERQQS